MENTQENIWDRGQSNLGQHVSGRALEHGQAVRGGAQARGQGRVSAPRRPAHRRAGSPNLQHVG